MTSPDSIGVTATELRGDAGPCDHVDCDQRAEYRIDVYLMGVLFHGYACEVHSARAQAGMSLLAGAARAQGLAVESSP